MPNVISPSHRRRLAAGLITVLGVTALAGTGLDGAAAASSSTCRSSDLSYRRDDGGGLILTARVARLRSRLYSCAAARDVAGYVTKQALYDHEITRYRNFRITAAPSGPDTQVSARRPVGDGRVSIVTFTIEGGR